MEYINKTQLIKSISGKSLFIKAVGDGYIRTTRKELLAYIRRNGFNTFMVLVAIGSETSNPKLYVDGAAKN